MNEETARALVLSPVLQAMGFDPDELTYERWFGIQLGRGVFNVKNAEVPDAKGRADILCRRGGQPFLVVELKAPDETLTDADRRQGLTYARLVEPMAPFVLLTNTRDSRLFDTVTGKEVDRGLSGAEADAYSPAFGSEIELRAQALQDFVGYSYENLLIFCRAHNERLLALLGAAQDEPAESRLRKKYIPEVYVQRERIQAALDAFVQSGRGVFPVVGDSGTGKTNLLCHLVRTLADSQPVLFFSGTYLHASLAQYVADSFNLVFSPQETGLSVLKKVAALAVRHGPKPIFVLDSLDEWDAPDKAAQMDQLAGWMDSLGLRLVVACKSQVWPEFVSRGGLPSMLSQHLHPEALPLADFAGEEVAAAEQAYARAFHVALQPRGYRPDSLNPFAMRMAFEVSRDTGASVDLGAFSRATVTRYLDARLPAAGGPTQPRRFVMAVADEMFRSDRPQVPEDDLRAGLRIPFGAELPELPFRLDVLYRYVDDLGGGHLGFYFSMVRDHLVAVHHLRLPARIAALSPAEWDEILSRQQGESAIRYFFGSGTAQEQQACVEAIAAYDVRAGSAVLVRLLAWLGNRADPGAMEACADTIAEQLRHHVEENTDDHVLAEQVVQASAVLPAAARESLLTDYFRVLLDRGHDKLTISNRIAEGLDRGTDPGVTARLVEMVLDSAGDGYVRRYIVEGLRSRHGFDKRATFVALITDPEINVRNSARGWYADLEDEALRDEVLSLLDTHADVNLRKDLVILLGRSKYPETGELLYSRMMEGGWTDYVKQWTWRALAWLKYSQAVPLYLDEIRQNPASEPAGHALIATGDMKAREAIGGLLDLVRAGSDALGQNWIWLSHAFHGIALPEDYAALEEIARTPPAAGADDLAVLLLAGSADRQWDALVLEYVSRDVERRFSQAHVFREWIRSLTQERLPEGMTRSRPGPVSLAPDVRETLFGLFEKKAAFSPDAMALLLATEPDVGRVCKAVQRVLPGLEHSFFMRQLALALPDGWDAAAEILRPWLHQTIALASTPPVLAQNCFELLKVMASRSTLDFISTHRERFNAIAHAEVVDELEHRIMQDRLPML